ncbi:MAG: hypothetical protein CVT59_05570 [Actinobacteria bacterium HGW-Actinobacteria-1]|nr:MAG: hypothetical protein CVT59_05570 [Actinobacteria bacterium HGW-Actinobacteria-1]
MSLRDDLTKLQNQLGEGTLQRSYGSIISYMSQARSYFMTRDGERAVSALYQGVFDMTYFALFPPALKSRGLKLAIVFDYESFTFQVWLAARNRTVQRKYWQLLHDCGWSGGRIVEPAAGVDAIVQRDVASAMELEAADALTARVEAVACELLDDLVAFLDTHDTETAV